MVSDYFCGYYIILNRRLVAVNSLYELCVCDMWTGNRNMLCKADCQYKLFGTVLCDCNLMHACKRAELASIGENIQA